MIESYMGPTAAYAGSNSERQSVGLPGHCVDCAEHGHVKAHPDLGCGDVGCNAFHSETPPEPEAAPQSAPPQAAEPDLTSVLLEHARAEVTRLSRALATQRDQAFRLEFFQVLAEFPCDHTVATTTWPEEPNDDATVDVDLGAVFDADGVRVDDLGGGGAVPAGWFDEGSTRGYRTAVDVWRVDESDAESVISLAKMHSWLATLSTETGGTRDTDQGTA